MGCSLCLNAVFVAMQALYKKLGEGKYTYASLPTVNSSPKAIQCGKLDAAALNQHEVDSSAMDDSANEQSDSGSTC